MAGEVRLLASLLLMTERFGALLRKAERGEEGNRLKGGEGEDGQRLKSSYLSFASTPTFIAG